MLIRGRKKKNRAKNKNKCLKRKSRVNYKINSYWLHEMSQHGWDLSLNFKLKIITKRKITINIKLTNRKPKWLDFPKMRCRSLPKAMSFDPHGDSIQVTKLMQFCRLHWWFLQVLSYFSKFLACWLLTILLFKESLCCLSYIIMK